MDKFVENFSGLGIAYNCIVPNFLSDPEKSLIDSIEIVSQDTKALKLVLCWLSNYEDLLHIERLKALIRISPITTKAWIGGIASFMGANKRWATILREVEGIRIKVKRMNDLESLQVKRLGLDPNFKKYGIHLPSFDMEGMEKKLLNREYVLRNHFWLRLRAMFGANWRADIVWQMYLNPDQTPYQVAKTLGCNTETAYRNWKSLEQSNVQEFLRKK